PSGPPSAPGPPAGPDATAPPAARSYLRAGPGQRWPRTSPASPAAVTSRPPAVDTRGQGVVRASTPGTPVVPVTRTTAGATAVPGDGQTGTPAAASATPASSTREATTVRATRPEVSRATTPASTASATATVPGAAVAPSTPTT